MKRQLIILIILTLPLGSIDLYAQKPAPREIMKRASEVTQIQGLEMINTLEIHDGKGNVRVRKTTSASRVFPDGTEKRIILFLSPADVAGTGMLIFDYPDKEDDMWLYLPALRKSRKIVATEKSSSFMGSEFSNSDLSISSLDDFTYKHLEPERIQGTLCWKIEMTPVDQSVSRSFNLSRKIMWISQEDGVPRQAELTDTRGRLHKRVTYSGIQSVTKDHAGSIITSMDVKNLQNGRFSRMTTEEFKFSPALDASLFTLAKLESQ